MNDSGKIELHPGEPPEYAKNNTPEKVWKEAHEWDKINNDRVESATGTLKEQATRDQLTGLFNRRIFDEILTTEFKETVRGMKSHEVMKMAPMVLVLFDLD